MFRISFLACFDGSILTSQCKNNAFVSQKIFHFELLELQIRHRNALKMLQR